MAQITKVGNTVPTQARNATGTITPGWAADMPRNAGDLLIARVGSSGAGGVLSTVTPGWVGVGAGDIVQTTVRIRLFYAFAAGADAAPTFTSAGATAMSAGLEEFTPGMLLTGSDGSAGAVSGPLTVTAALAAAYAGGLAVTVGGDRGAATAPDSETPDVGWNASGWNTANVSSHFGGDYQLNPSTAAPPSELITVSMPNLTAIAAQIAIFLPSRPSGSVGLGVKGAGLGLRLGADQIEQSFALPVLGLTTQPYIAHLFDHNLVFKRTLGGASILNKPGLKLTQNGGYQQILLEVASSVAGLVLGDVIRLTERGDNTGIWLFTGNVETTPEEIGVGAVHHLISVTPWVAELGDGYFNQTYAVATDVAQFVRDAVATTAHLSVTPWSCPDSGVKAIYDFQDTNPLDAVHVARQIAGAQWFYFVDPEGIVWFQPVVAANPPTLTLRRGIDYNASKSSASVTGMKNKIPIVGGSNPGDPGRISSLYDGVANQGLYGTKAFNPTLAFPTVTDQATLDAIAASLGAAFDRVLHTVELTVPALGSRLSPGRRGGLTVRLWEPAREPLGGTASGAGGYGPTLILQDVEVEGSLQRLTLGDIPYADLDTAYEATRVAQRMAASGATAVPIPPVAPQPNPPSTVVYGRVNATPGIKAMGGGIVTIATATFTTASAGVCQVIGSVDARMEAWDNYVATPRRAVRASLSGGIFTGAWQELPFGLARATYDLSSASGLALAAGTYTVKIEIDTQEFNQMHIYSGFVQVVWTG